MLKKIMVVSLLIISFLYSADISVDIESNNWKLNAPNDNSVHVIYLPTNVSLTDLQNSLSANQSLIIYNLAAYSDWMKVYNTSAIPFIVALKVTPTSIQYLTKVNGEVKSFDNYDDFITYMKNLNLVPAKGFSLDDYLSYFKEIKAGGVYYIKSSGDNLTFDINFGKSSNSSTLDGIVSANIESNNWKLNAPNDNSVHVIYLPTNVSLTDLQNSLSANQSLIIYNLAAYSDWMKVYNTSAIPFIVALKVTPTSIQYLTKVNGEVKSFDNYDDFITYMKNLNLVPAKGFSLDDYLSYFKEIKAGGVYYIKSSGDNLTFDINFGKSSNSSNGSVSSNGETNSSSNTDLNTPPQPESGNSGLQVPPSVPVIK